jgi:hypothetical protein
MKQILLFRLSPTWKYGRLRQSRSKRTFGGFNLDKTIRRSCQNRFTGFNVAGTGIGGVGSALEMANTAIKGFVNSHRTQFIYQPAIGSFYEGGQYSFKELISERDPCRAGFTMTQAFRFCATSVGLLILAGKTRVIPQGFGGRYLR